MTTSARARAAGRRFAGGAAQTALSMAGGAVYYGAHALATPSIYGTDPNNIPKRSWMLPVLGIIAGHAVTMMPKAAAAGYGVAGGATAIGLEQIQMGISIKKNQAASGMAPAAGTSGVGALLEPRDIRPAQLAGAGVGEVEYEDAGALWGSPTGVHEAAGLTI